MGPHARAPRRAARDRARSQHAAAGPPPGADRPLRRASSRSEPRLCRAPSRRSARPRSSSARRSRPGPIWSARRPRTICCALQDSLPPVPFAAIRAEIEAQLRPPARRAVRQHRSRAGRRRLDRAGPPRRHHRRPRRSRSRCCAPASTSEFARDIETYEWAAAQLEALGGEAARLRPRLVIANFKRWTKRELDLRREAASASELADGDEGPSRLCDPRRSTGTAPTAAC